jgi:hypothetical protein
LAGRNQQAIASGAPAAGTLAALRKFDPLNS